MVRRFRHMHALEWPSLLGFFSMYRPVRGLFPCLSITLRTEAADLTALPNLPDITEQKIKAQDGHKQDLTGECTPLAITILYSNFLQLGNSADGSITLDAGILSQPATSQRLRFESGDKVDCPCFGSSYNNTAYGPCKGKRHRGGTKLTEAEGFTCIHTPV
ncbi:hypothetical protein V6N13_072327 [Hibiscus sabdariffa]|uniref:Uncharacterized protein n=1 Tax=Hibiscus sabdariffa TaxID=183260 RepID=A0ABR2FP27_9ROSI